MERNFDLFGENLSRMRWERMLTRKKLAEMSGGITYNLITAYETHRCLPSLYTAVRIADALGVTVDDMLKEIKELK